MSEDEDVSPEFVDYVAGVVEAEWLESGGRVYLEVDVVTLDALHEVRELGEEVFVETFEQGFADIFAHFRISFDSSAWHAAVYERVVQYELLELDLGIVCSGVTLFDDAYTDITGQRGMSRRGAYFFVARASE